MSQLDHWSLNRLPFGPPRKAQDYFIGGSQHEALARLEFLIEHGRSTALVLGPALVGRSSLLRYLASGNWTAAAKYTPLWIEATDSPQDLLAQVADSLGLGALPAALRWRAIADETATAARGGSRTVLLVDDAEFATAEALHGLARLIGACPAISLVASCRGDRYEGVVDALGGCPLRIDLSGWDLGEMRDFLRKGLQAAGARPDLFTDQAVIRLSELSEGLPGYAARLAELALLAGAGCEATKVDPDLIEAAAGELLRIPVA